MGYEHRHFVLYKPAGVVSQFVYPHKRKKKVLGELYNFPEGTMAIGRLDVKSEGLLLLTTDGQVSENIRSKSVEKEYHIQVNGIITNEAIQKMMEGVEIGFEGKRYITKPCKAERIDTPDYHTDGIKIRDKRHGPTSWASITLTEGKFRQVRKMSAAVGFPTLRLIRIRIGSIYLDTLGVGDVIEVDDLIL